MPRRRSTPSIFRADSVVLDLAAGTGKLTRQLVARFARVIAVEPLDGMRAVLERIVPEAEALRGSADAIPLADDVRRRGLRRRSLPLVRERRRRGRDRTRAPAGGVLAILFNQLDGDVEPPSARRRSGRRTGTGAIEKSPEQTVGTGLWQAPFPGPFEPFTEASYPNPVELDREGILAQASSWSMIAALPESDRKRLLAQLAELLPDEHYRHPLRTDLYWARLR